MENPLYNTENYAYICEIKRKNAMESAPEMLSILDHNYRDMARYKTPDEIAQYMAGLSYGLFLAGLIGGSSSPVAELLQLMEDHSRSLGEAVLAEAQTEQP